MIASTDDSSSVRLQWIRESRKAANHLTHPVPDSIELATHDGPHEPGNGVTSRRLIPVERPAVTYV